MKLKLLACTFFAASLLYAAPQSQFPDTPAAHQFAAWLEAFNSGDRGKLLEFLQKNNPSRAGDIDGEMGFRRMTGGFEFKKAEESTATKFTGIVKERDSDTFARFSLEVEAAEPHQIKGMDLRQIPIPTEFALPRMSQDAALASLRAELDKRAAADSFAGAVLVAKDGKPVFKAAYGLADREKKTPNQIDHTISHRLHEQDVHGCVGPSACAGRKDQTHRPAREVPD